MKKFLAIFLAFSLISAMLLPVKAVAADGFTVIGAGSAQFSVKTAANWKESTSLIGPGGKLQFTNIENEWCMWDLSGVKGEKDLYYHAFSHSDGLNDATAKLEVCIDGKTTSFTVDHNAKETGWYKIGTFSLSGSKDQYIKLSRTGPTYGFYTRASAVGYAPKDAAVDSKGDIADNTKANGGQSGESVIKQGELSIISVDSDKFTVKTPANWKASPAFKGAVTYMKYTNIKDEWGKWDLSGVDGEQDLYYYLMNHSDGKNDGAAKLEVYVGGKKFIYSVDHNNNPQGWYHLGTFKADGSEGQYIRMTRIGASYGYNSRVESVGYAKKGASVSVKGTLKGTEVIGYTAEDEKEEQAQQQQQASGSSSNVFVSQDKQTIIISPIKDGDNKTLFGVWGKSGALKDYNEDSTYYTATTGDRAEYRPGIKQAGKVRVLFFNLFYANNNETITVKIHTDSGVTEQVVTHAGQYVSGWHDCGVFEFGGSGNEYVELVKGEVDTTVNTRVGSVMFQLSPDTQELPKPMEAEAKRAELPEDAPPVPDWATEKSTPFNANTFPDIQGHWAKATVENLVQRGIINGKSATAFEPDAQVTNAELATMFLNLLKLPQGASGANWYDSYVSGAESAGLLSNTPVAGNPEETATRLTLAHVLYNTMQVLGYKPEPLTENKFEELNALSGADKTAAEAVVSSKLMIGSNGALGLSDNMTRAEAVTVMERIMRLSMPQKVAQENGNYVLKNERYAVSVSPDGNILLTTDGQSYAFKASGRAVYNAKAPDLKQQNVEEDRVTYNIPSWTLYGTEGAVIGEAHEFHKMESKVEGRTENLFGAGIVVDYNNFSVSATDTEIVFTSAGDEYGVPKFTLSLEQGTAHPKLKIEYTLKKDGYFTFGYNGFPSFTEAEAEEIWQPMVWTERRFPLQSYMTPEYHLPAAGTAVRTKGYTLFYGVAQEDLPYKIPTYENSRYGAVLKSKEGNIQPQIYLPFYGSTSSNKKAGDSVSLLTEISVYKGDVATILPDLISENYGFYDFRSNGNISMNEVIENMIGYGMNDYYSKFMPEYKGFSYENDAPGTTKNVSAVHPASLALVYDDKALYDNRALPLSEYMMSRNDLTYKYVETASQGSNALGVPAMKMNEYAALYQMSGNTVKAYYDKMTEKGSPAKTDWKQAMVYYKATNDPSYLEIAKKGADKYIETRLSGLSGDYNSVSSSWWHFFCPDYTELYELYEMTGEQKYLDAAHVGARRFAMFLWYTPGVPDGTVHINENNVAPKYAYNRGIMPMEAEEKDIEAWKVSEIGLHAEAAFTSHGHRGIFMSFHAPYFMKIGADTDDEFLKSVARHAVVGRYENFPGYHINTGYTDVYMAKDFPFKTYEQLTYNSFHYNHIWPHITMLLDFLYADVYDKTNGQVQTNGIYVDSYAYVKTNAYGALPGKFYHIENAYPYMPAKALSIDNPQLNYATYRADDTLCIVFTNQSKKDVTANVTINLEAFGMDKNKAYNAEVWVNNAQLKHVEQITGGTFRVDVSKEGVYALAIHGVNIIPKLAPAENGTMFGAESSNLQPTAAGNIRSMVLGFGEGTETVYIYSDSTPAQVKEMRVSYTANGKTETVTDSKHPFEFTLPYADDFSFSATLVTLDGAELEIPLTKVHK